jgi:hypothetical protein
MAWPYGMEIAPPQLYNLCVICWLWHFVGNVKSLVVLPYLCNISGEIKLSVLVITSALLPGLKWIGLWKI